MAWSTREVAELAGTTVKAVRHYHAVGLLDEPERATNGYKQYGVAHLTRLLRVRRLTDLGVSLPQVAAVGGADEHPDGVLRVLDAELAVTVDRLQRVRVELAVMLRNHLATDLPAGLAQVTQDLSDADRGLMVVYARVLGADGIEALRRMLTEFRHNAVDAELDQLPADADEGARRDLVARLLPHVVAKYHARPDVLSTHLTAPGGTRRVARTIHLAMTDLYNPAQLDVLERVGRLLHQRATRTTSGRPQRTAGRTARRQAAA